ncbi:MAG: DinB family protein [Saprospiraceae bacterium]
MKKQHPNLLHIIHHVFNQGTYHRGQLVTMGRALGFLHPPSTDFIHFKRMI